MKYVFQNPREINGVYDFTYHLIDEQSFYFPLGFQPNAEDATIAPTNGGIVGMLADTYNVFNQVGNVFGTALLGRRQVEFYLSQIFFN